MAVDNQLSFGDGLLSSRRKRCKLADQLRELDQLIDWPVSGRNLRDR